MSCNAYHQVTKYDSDGRKRITGLCYGTKECDECNCGGDRLKCDFYDSVRKYAIKELISTAPLTTVPSNTEVININTLIDALLQRSFDEQQTFPWWVFEEIYKWNANNTKGV